MSSRHSRLFLFIFLILFPVSAISQESVSSEDITYAANFYADYVDLFGEPPNVLIINENRINLAQAAYLFAKAVSAKTDEVKLIDIKGYDNFTTNTESEITKKDVIAVSRLYARYLERFHEFPYLIKLNRVFASNADFIYILADMLRQKYKSNSFPEKIKNKKLYFEDIINWVSLYTIDCTIKSPLGDP